MNMSGSKEELKQSNPVEESKLPPNEQVASASGGYQGRLMKVFDVNTSSDVAKNDTKDDPEQMTGENQQSGININIRQVQISLANFTIADSDKDDGESFHTQSNFGSERLPANAHELDMKSQNDGSTPQQARF